MIMISTVRNSSYSHLSVCVFACVLGGNPDVAMCVWSLVVRYVPDPRLIWKQRKTRQQHGSFETTELMQWIFSKCARLKHLFFFVMRTPTHTRTHAEWGTFGRVGCRRQVKGHRESRGRWGGERKWILLHWEGLHALEGYKHHVQETSFI